jgi:hypothetical protein
MSAANFDHIIEALSGKREGSSWRCECPVHPGQRHLNLTPRNGSTPLFHCFQGASQEEVITALQDRKLWPEAGSEPQAAQSPTGRLEVEYRYIGADGQVVAVKGRFRKPDGDKSFAWRRPGDDGWHGLKGTKERDLPLYNAHLLAADDGSVLVCEGEKACDACLDAGLLAVCSPGGASAKDFGRQLEPLAGRDVILWADNDDAGRALMQRIALRLQGVAASIRTVAPDAPPKADAWDFFHGGGLKEAVLAMAARVRTTPWILEIPNGYEVGVPIMGGAAMFRFERLEEQRHVLLAEVSVRAEIPGMSREPFSGRLNLLSLSQRDTFRRQLEDIAPLGKGGWTGILNRACEMVRQAHSEADPSIDLANVPVHSVAAAYMVPPLVLADAPTVHFGDGGTCKTYLALRLAASVALGADFLGQAVRQAPVLFLDYEASETAIKRRLLRILAGMGLEWRHFPFIYWPAHGRALPEIVPALQRKIRQAGIGYLMVDSAAYAAGQEPEKADSAIRHFNSLAAFEIPSLSLAHLGKEGKDEWPFGSIFWSNGPRLTWNTKATREDGNEVTHLGLFNRKGNEDRLHRPIGIRLDFSPDAVIFSCEELQAGTEDRANLGQRLLAELHGGARSSKQMSESLGVSVHQIRTRAGQMREIRSLGRAADGSGLWGLKADE